MSSRRIELLASATQTASGQSAKFAVTTLTMGMVGLDVTAADTVSDFTAWLEGSDDGGTTWYELVADHVLPSTGVAAGGTVAANDRDICDGVTAAGKHAAVYKHLCADYIRLAWTLAGTSVTFSASLVGK